MHNVNLGYCKELLPITTECRGIIVTNESRNTNNQLQCIPEHVEKLLIFYVFINL